MSDTYKKIEKVKSFDKRLSLLFNADPLPSGEELKKCLNLVVEKAKYGEHFAQIGYMCEIKKFKDLDTLKKCALKAIEHPRQTGCVLRALFFNGFEADGKALWESSVILFSSHPSFKAQILARGLWFDQTRPQAEAAIAEFLASGPEAAEYEEQTHEQDAPNYINI